MLYNNQWSFSDKPVAWLGGVHIACVLFRFYTVVAPRVLRPNSDYHVAITTQETSQPTTVTVAVSGKQHGGGMFEASQTASVEPYITRIVKLEVSDIFTCCTFFTFWKNVYKVRSPYFITFWKVTTNLSESNKQWEVLRKKVVSEGSGSLESEIQICFWSFHLNSKLHTFQTQRADGLNYLLPLFWILCDNCRCGNSINIMVFWVLIWWWLVSEYQNDRGICHCHLHFRFEGSMKMMAASWFRMLVSAYESRWCHRRRQWCECLLVWKPQILDSYWKNLF